VYNEPYPQPAEPEGVDVEGILKGIHLVSPAADGDGARAQVLASGVSVPWALKAQQMLLEEWGVKADVWSVTSWNELRRDGLEVDRHNLLNPAAEPRVAFVTQRLAGQAGAGHRGLRLDARGAGPDSRMGSAGIRLSRH